MNLSMFDNNSTPLPRGTRIKKGQFEIISDTPNAGGFGRIYRAYGSKMNKNGERHVVAIKEFFVNEFLETPLYSMGYCTRNERERLLNEMQRNFREEAHTLALLNQQKDKHVPTIHGRTFWDSGRLFYVMTFINGPTLTEDVEEHGLMAEEKAVDYIVQIGKVLYKAHRWGVMHCDVSPNNIMLENGIAKLVDFGNARSYAKALNFQFNPEEQIGTPGFCPPPLFAGSPRGDIYSLAATLFFLLTGKRVPSLKTTHSSVAHSKIITFRNRPSMLYNMP